MGLPCLAAFPGAVGTGIIISTDRPLGERLHGAIADLIEDYERALSRFRQDAIPAQMAQATHGGKFVFPDYCRPMPPVIWDGSMGGRPGAMTSDVRVLSLRLSVRSALISGQSARAI
ncbi:hypothetical protein [Bifidobacterium polysaccharolyticum]|uniref:hypothetical protein n=1 Tax=Bifidobacterium polysaccharolyticum TaxID=2750967 RepID=UPI0021BA676B|nr:hypothetical protein [Bifidobacterium polysaccharolyticum]MCT8157355.1 hypothetical protein [Bifidobacterium polysaccharolyticum]